MSTIQNLLRERLSNKTTEPPVKETTTREKTETAINSVEGVFPGAKTLLTETAIIESKMGEDVRAGNNVFQLTETGIDAVKDLKSHPNLKSYHTKIKEEFDLDIMNMSYDDFKTNPLAGALAARMLYGNVPTEIPSSIEGRAKYWKDNYNSSADVHGTTNAYIEQVGQFK
jgi:hypothetical protein